METNAIVLLSCVIFYLISAATVCLIMCGAIKKHRMKIKLYRQLMLLHGGIFGCLTMLVALTNIGWNIPMALVLGAAGGLVSIFIYYGMYRFARLVA